MNTAPYSEGPMDAKILLLGEAPGEDEVRRQRPFVGRAGKQLDRLLHTSGILRAECKLDNVFQVRPPANKIKPFLDLGHKLPVESGIYKQNLHALKTRLETDKPNIVVTFGNVPLWAMTGKKGILKQRGSLFESTLVPGLKILATIHPAAVLRGTEGGGAYLYNHYIVLDLKRAKDNSSFPELRLPKRHFYLEPSEEQVLKYIRSCNSLERVAIDIELRGSQVSHISLARSPTDGICIPFVDGNADYFTPEQETDIWCTLAELFENRKVTKIGQNIIFDNTFMFRRMGIRVAPVEDTMIGFAVLYPDFPKGLDFITSVYCNGEPYYKDEGKTWTKNPFATELDFRHYNAMDSAVCLEAWIQMEKDLKSAGYWETYNRQRQLIEPLTYMQARGILMDKEGLRMASENADKKILGLRHELYEELGFELNPNSPKQLMDYYYGELKIKPYLHKGRPTTRDQAMKRLARRNVPGARLISKIRHEVKLKGTYFDVLLDGDNRLRCSYNPAGTKQGRISSSKTIFGTGGNLQNQPPEMKRLMLADKGMILIVLDLSQAENRVVAYVANEPKMIEAFEQGIDIHRQTAGLMFGKTPEDISGEKGSSPIGDGSHSERDWGKRANHGLNYGLAYRTFALNNEIEETEAKLIVEAFHGIYPGIRQWHRRIQNELRTNNRTLTNCYGRKRKFMDRMGDELFRDAYAFIPQSSVADKLNSEGVVVSYSNQSLYKHVDLLNQVHDSIVFQYPIERGAHELARVIVQLMKSLERPVYWKGKGFIIPVDVQLGSNLVEMVEVKKATEGSLIETLLTIP